MNSMHPLCRSLVLRDCVHGFPHSLQRTVHIPTRAENDVEGESQWNVSVSPCECHICMCIYIYLYVPEREDSGCEKMVVQHRVSILTNNVGCQRFTLLVWLLTGRWISRCPHFSLSLSTSWAVCVTLLVPFSEICLGRYCQCWLPRASGRIRFRLSFQYSFNSIYDSLEETMISRCSLSA